MGLRALRLSALLAAALVAGACAQQRTMVLPAADPALFDLRVPVEVAANHAISGRHGYVVAGAGEGAGTGMLAGAGAALYGGASTGDPLGLLLGVALAPVFAVGGGVYGAAAAHPSDETGRAIAAIEAVYADSDLLGSIDREVAHAFEKAHFAIAPDCDVAGPDVAACRADSARSRLRLEESYAFGTKGAYSPDLIFVISVEAVASGPDPNAEAETFRWVYVSPEMDFFASTMNDAAALRQAVAQAQTRIARRIVEDLHTARREVGVSGTWWPDHSGVNFTPTPATPGLVTRAPTQAQLINVPESALK